MSDPQLKVQEVLRESLELKIRVAEENAESERNRARMCIDQYAKLSRRYVLLVNRKKLELKKLTDYTVVELLCALWWKFLNLFRKKP